MRRRREAVPRWRSEGERLRLAYLNIFRNSIQNKVAREKECIFQSFDQNKVHFNQNLGSKSSAFQASESKALAKAVPPQSPAADLARRAG